MNTEIQKYNIMNFNSIDDKLNYILENICYNKIKVIYLGISYFLIYNDIEDMELDREEIIEDGYKLIIHSCSKNTKAICEYLNYITNNKINPNFELKVNSEKKYYNITILNAYLGDIEIIKNERNKNE